MTGPYHCEYPEEGLYDDGFEQGEAGASEASELFRTRRHDEVVLQADQRVGVLGSFNVDYRVRRRAAQARVCSRMTA